MNIKLMPLLSVKLSAVILAMLLETSCSPKDPVASTLPNDSIVLMKYQSGWLGNGDYIYAMKVEMGEGSFVRFAEGLGLSDKVLDWTMVIGYNSKPSDMPLDKAKEWGEPKTPKFKYYKNTKHNFERLTYSDGIAYYYSMGW